MSQQTADTNSPPVVGIVLVSCAWTVSSKANWLRESSLAEKRLPDKNTAHIDAGRSHVFPMADARFSWLQRTVQAVLPVEAEKWTQLMQEEQAKEALYLEHVLRPENTTALFYLKIVSEMSSKEGGQEGEAESATEGVFQPQSDGGASLVALPCSELEEGRGNEPPGADEE
eukprot:Skav216997  [mRNA]  locus=scaffold1803:7270:11665:+ [translate_table: standard]